MNSEWLQEHLARTGKTEQEVQEEALKLYQFLIEHGFTLFLISDGTGHIKQDAN